MLAVAAIFPYAPAGADPVPDYLYTKVFDLLDFDADVRTFAGATDSNDNTYVGGEFTGTVAFDGMGGSVTATADSSHPTAFVTKRNASGTHTWTRTVDASAGWAEVRGLAINDSGEVFATGMFFDTVIFDGVGGSDSVTSANQNTYLTKYNANGSYAWTETFDVSGGGTEARGVALDDTGNIYLGGEFFGTVIFDGVGGSDSVTTTSGNAYVTKYSPTGTYTWTSHFDLSSPGDVEIGDIAVDDTGNAYVAGAVDGDVTYGGSDNVNTGNEAAFMAKFNTGGTYQFARTFDVDAGGGGFANAFDVAVDPSGNIFFGGDFGSDVVFDGVGGSDAATANSSNCAFLTKYNANGTYGWTKYVDDTNGEANVFGVVTDDLGNVYTTGEFDGDIVFDGVGGSDTQSDQSVDAFPNAFLTQYEASDGAYGWTKSFDTTNGMAGGEEAMVDTDNFVYMTGWAAEIVVFDGVGGSDSVDFTANGAFRSSFLTKYDTSSGSGGGGSSDSDGDGASDTTEDNAPNGGDANNDGQPDSGQDNVTSAVSAVTSTYIVLVSPANCQITAMTTSSESNNAVQDSGFNYPYGFVGFQVDCDTNGLTANLTLYHYNQFVNGLVLRKYFPSNSAYSTISSAVIGQSTIGGQSVVTASYQITDGGVFDTDGVANSVIVDPVGLGVPVVGVPNTGLGGRASQ